MPIPMMIAERAERMEKNAAKSGFCKSLPNNQIAAFQSFLFLSTQASLQTSSWNTNWA
jgi:hypothetical protein